MLDWGQSPGETGTEGKRLWVYMGDEGLVTYFTIYDKEDLAKLSFTYRAITLCEMRTVVLLVVVGLCVWNVTSSLKICAFNVQSFGESKANNKKVMGILLKVLYCMCTTTRATSTHS